MTSQEATPMGGFFHHTFDFVQLITFTNGTVSFLGEWTEVASGGGHHPEASSGAEDGGGSGGRGATEAGGSIRVQCECTMCLLDLLKKRCRRRSIAPDSRRSHICPRNIPSRTAALLLSLPATG
ncbi:hypothetical protein AAG570_006186 [Ranatra chinensis]|uniref:Uncharacterized protein n=1 Tax=Ranatra chinensis TaxID=642074 RepID=A0ABD0XXA8_9HEMI